MSLVDALAARKRRYNTGRPCKWSIVMAALTPEERAAFQAALKDPTTPLTVIRSVLSEAGHDPGDASIISRHRRGECGWCNAQEGTR